MRKIAATGIAAAASLALVATGLSPANAAEGSTPLSEVLTADGDNFDADWNDFDVVTEAVLAVLADNPDSAVSLLTKGDMALTAFVPTDRAFRYLVRDLTGSQPATEEDAFNAVAGLGLDTVETVLLYHVVPGATITAAQALKSNNAKLETGTRQTVKVKVRGEGPSRLIKLSDKDYNSRNPRVIVTDVNEGNMQIAHAINRVLRPMDLPPVKGKGQVDLASVLTSDKNQFDRDRNDFDIATEAVLAVLGAKPDSAVKVLTDGGVALTAFVPNDRAFKILARDLTGKKIGTEQRAFSQLVAALGVDTIESVLLYHVVPGSTITAKQAMKSDDARLKTALGSKFKVNVVGESREVRLQDKDRNSRNPRVIVADVNKGNLQIAHGLDRVLRPVDLPPLNEH